MLYQLCYCCWTKLSKSIRSKNVFKNEHLRIREYKCIQKTSFSSKKNGPNKLDSFKTDKPFYLTVI